MKTTVWYCDTCNGEISDPEGSLVVWDFDSNLAKGGFGIVHKGRKCDRDSESHSMELSHMIGADGQEHLLSFLSYGPLPIREGTPRVADIDGFVDLFRRLHTPGYEEARRYFNVQEVQEQFSSANEFAAFTPSELEWIIKTGRKLYRE